MSNELVVSVYGAAFQLLKAKDVIKKQQELIEKYRDTNIFLAQDGDRLAAELKAAEDLIEYMDIEGNCMRNDSLYLGEA